MLWDTHKDDWWKGEIPRNWENTLIVHIYREGQHVNSANFRPICLSQFQGMYNKDEINTIYKERNGERTNCSPEKQMNNNIHIFTNLIEREQIFNLRLAFAAIENVINWKCLGVIGNDRPGNINTTNQKRLQT